MLKVLLIILGIIVGLLFLAVLWLFVFLANLVTNSSNFDADYLENY